MTPDIGVLGYGLGADRRAARRLLGQEGDEPDRLGLGRFSSGGIITYVGVLTEMGVVDLLGEGAVHLGSPLGGRRPALRAPPG